MEQNTKVPVKLTLLTSKRRVRLDAPLKFSQLQQRVRECFPSIKDFKLHYVDEEDDNIRVSSDEELSEAQSIFKHLGRVLSFTLTSPDRPMQSTTAGAMPSSPKCSTGRQKEKAPKSHTNKPKSHANKPAAAPKSCDAEHNLNQFQNFLRNFSENPECLAEVMRPFIDSANKPAAAAKSCDAKGNVNQFQNFLDNCAENPECLDRLGEVMGSLINLAMGSKSCAPKGNFEQVCRMAGTCADGMRSRIAAASPKAGVVELHSLSSAHFNGRRGRRISFDHQKGRHHVMLFATKIAPAQTIAVRTHNIKVISPIQYLLGTCTQSSEQVPTMKAL